MKTEERITAINSMNTFILNSKRCIPVKRFVIESIVEARTTTEGRSFLVKWKGHEVPTWEPEANIFDDAPLLLRNFDLR